LHCTPLGGTTILAQFVDLRPNAFNRRLLMQLKTVELFDEVVCLAGVNENRLMLTTQHNDQMLQAF